VGHAGIYWVALVVVADSFSGVGEEHPVTVASLRLQHANGEILLGDGVGVRLFVRTVQGVDLLAQHRTF